MRAPFLAALLSVATPNPIPADHPLLREPAVQKFLRAVREQPALVAELISNRSSRQCEPRSSDTAAAMLQLPDPPLPGGIIRERTRLDLKCSCAEGFEVGPSNALPLEVPSVQSMNGRCAATKLVISLAPNPARAISLTPPPRALTAQEVRAPACGGRVSGFADQGCCVCAGGWRPPAVSLHARGPTRRRRGSTGPKLPAR